MGVEIATGRPLKGELTVPADKSISHRAVLLGAIARGDSEMRNLLKAADVDSSISCIRALGVEIRSAGDVLVIAGRGLEGLIAPAGPLNCGNSGTTMRLLAGILATQDFDSLLLGDESLSRRPMRRIIEPLLRMGAQISGQSGTDTAPLKIHGGRLQGIEYELPVASAQVKSAVLLAGLGAEGKTTVIEKEPSRDHTERMLKAMGARISCSGQRISIEKSELNPQSWLVPGDVSSAAFFMVAAAIKKGSEILLRDVGVNPTRTGIIEALIQMGAVIKMENLREIGGEPVADLLVSAGPLRPITVKGSIIPRIIDEIPVLAVAMAVAEGTSEVRDAGELRAKESDRITMICRNLAALGVSIEEYPDGFAVHGTGCIPGGKTVASGGDHRIAMASAVAGLVAREPVKIEGFDCVHISYPDFLKDLEKLIQ